MDALANYLWGSSSPEVHILEEIVKDYTELRWKYVLNELSDPQSRALASSQPLLVYVCVSLHMLLRQSQTDLQRVRAQDLAMCLSGIMASVLDVLAPGSWSLEDSNADAPLTVASIINAMHRQYIKVAKGRKLPKGFDALAQKQDLSVKIQARGTEGTYVCKFTPSTVEFAKELCGMVAAADGSDMVFSLIESERLSWEAAGLPFQFGSRAPQLTLRKEVAAVESFVSFMDPVALKGLLEGMPGVESNWGTGAVLAGAAGGEPHRLQGSVLGINDFSMNDNTGILTYKGSAALPPEVLNEINGWRVLVPPMLQGNRGMIIARLKEADMGEWQNEISKAQRHASGCDKALLGSKLAESNFCAVHHGVGCCVLQVT